MGRAVTAPRDSIEALYKEFDNVWTWIRNQAGNRASLNIQNDGVAPLILQDGDGSVWIDATDNDIHYRVNGAEYKITGTLV